MDQKSEVFGEKKDDDFSFLYENTDKNTPFSYGIFEDNTTEEEDSNLVNTTNEEPKDEVEAFFKQNSKDDQPELTPLKREEIERQLLSDNAINEEEVSQNIDTNLSSAKNEVGNKKNIVVEEASSENDKEGETSNIKTQKSDVKEPQEVDIPPSAIQENIEGPEEVDIQSDIAEKNIEQPQEVEVQPDVAEENVEEPINEDIKPVDNIEENNIEEKDNVVSNEPVAEAQNLLNDIEVQEVDTNGNQLNEDNITDKVDEIPEEQSIQNEPETEDLKEEDKIAPKSEIISQEEEQNNANIQEEELDNSNITEEQQESANIQEQQDNSSIQEEEQDNIDIEKEENFYKNNEKEIVTDIEPKIEDNILEEEPQQKEIEERKEERIEEENTENTENNDVVEEENNKSSSYFSIREEDIADLEKVNDDFAFEIEAERIKNEQEEKKRIGEVEEEEKKDMELEPLKNDGKLEDIAELNLSNIEEFLQKNGKQVCQLDEKNKQVENIEEEKEDENPIDEENEENHIDEENEEKHSNKSFNKELNNFKLDNNLWNSLKLSSEEKKKIQEKVKIEIRKFLKNNKIKK